MDFGHIRCVLLAAGFGTRLKPLTDSLPKCLMPINETPLLEIWLDNLAEIGIKHLLVNLHYLPEQVSAFLQRKKYVDWVKSAYEPILLGTAGTLRENYNSLRGSTTLLIHGDNLCLCDFNEFLEFHIQKRPPNTLITMMTFETSTPESCGIVELNEDGVVINFFEKVKHPPGNLANAAIYLIEPEVLDWIMERKEVMDFSTQVLPHFVGKIGTWKNHGILRDIGNPKALKLSQTEFLRNENHLLDEWEMQYLNHPIHAQLAAIK